MRALDPSGAFEAELCRWHTLAKDVLPFPCTRRARPGRSTCSQHSAELDLRIFEAAHSPKCAWVIYWAAGSRIMKRCSAGDIAELLLRREPDGLLEPSKDRAAAMELRVRGRLVALIRRLE